MHTLNGITELNAAVGTHLGFSDWWLVDQARIDAFAHATGDRQWIHVDPERAARGPFGGTIAHGYLTLSLLPALVWEIFRVDGLAMEINYGLDKVRFPTPVPVGSKIRAGVELLAVDPKADGFQSHMRITMELEGSTKPACIAESLGYLVPA